MKSEKFNIEVGSKYLESVLDYPDLQAVKKYIDNIVPFKASIANFIINDLKSRLIEFLEKCNLKYFELHFSSRFGLNSNGGLTFEFDLAVEFDLPLEDNYDFEILCKHMNHKFNISDIELIY